VRELGKIGFLKLFLLEKEDKLEDLKLEETCYLLGGFGLYMYKSNELFKSLARCNVPNSPEVKPYIDASKLPKIPRRYMDQAICFFKKIYELHKSEAALILYWNKTEFKWSCPKQSVTGGSVSYKEDHPGDGWLAILHMHSHASMSAFHSGTDDKDEQYVDGYNITIGKMNTDSYEFECRIMLGKAQEKCTMSDIIENWVVNSEFPNEWLNNVESASSKIHTPVTGGQLSLFPNIERGSVALLREDCYSGIFLTKEHGGLL